MFRSQTDEQLAARHDSHPYVDQYGTRWETGRTDPLSTFAPRVECIPSRDPAPWVSKRGRRVADVIGNDGFWRFAPRPEFARPPVNRVLVRFREMQGSETATSRAQDWAFYGLTGSTAYGESLGATPAEIDHAHKVLTRLANLTERNTQ